MVNFINRFKGWCYFIFLLAFISQGISAKPDLKKIGQYNTGMSYGLAIKNNYAYITTNSSLFILDVKNPEKPVKSSEFVVGSPSFGLSILDNFAFLAASDRGLVIVDISDPGEPCAVGEYHGGGTMYNVKAVDDLCFTINYEKGFEIIDISNPAEPKRISGIPLTPRGFWIYEDTAYVSDPGTGLFILDISNQGNIKEWGVVEETKGAGGLRVHNGKLFVGSYENWIKVYDISDLWAPRFIVGHTYPYEVSGFAVWNDYLVTNYQGIKIQDISDLHNPAPFAEYRARGLKGMAHGIVVRNGYVYYVKKGLTVLKIEQE